MKPYFQDDAVTIYHGDCMDVMRDMPDAQISGGTPSAGSDCWQKDGAK